MSELRKIDDSSNILYKPYVTVEAEKQHFAFASKNIKILLIMGNRENIEAIIDKFSVCGYDFFRIPNAKNFGVPQDRERVIICGFRKDL